MASRWFPGNQLIIQVPFFLAFSLSKETPNYKGKRVLLGCLVIAVLTASKFLSTPSIPKNHHEVRGSGFQVQYDHSCTGILKLFYWLGLLALNPIPFWATNTSQTHYTSIPAEQTSKDHVSYSRHSLYPLISPTVVPYITPRITPLSTLDHSSCREELSLPRSLLILKCLLSFLATNCLRTTQKKSIFLLTRGIWGLLLFIF